jgi:replicative DNA helicase
LTVAALRDPFPGADRELPHDHAAEAAVLGAAMADVRACETVLRDLRAADLHLPGHAEIMAAIVALADRKEAVDIVTVAAELRARARMHALQGGEMYLSELAGAVTIASLAHVQAHIERVRTTAGLRRAICTMVEHTARAYSAVDLSVVTDAANRLRDLQGSTQRQLPELAHVDVIDAYAQPLPIAVPTGFPRVDEKIGGGQMGVVLLCGSTGSGKSSCAIQVAVSTACTRPVAYFSTELPVRQIYARIGAHLWGGGWLRILQGDAMMGRSLSQAMRPLRLRVAEIRTVDNLLRALDEVARAEREPPYVVIDYLQNFGRGAVDEDRRHVISAASDAITSWTRATGGTALVVSSVSRAMYQSDDKLSPDDFLAAAKESGDLEYDSSTVLFLAVPKPPLGGVSEGRLVISKARFGGVGTVGMRFDGPSGRFSELAEADLSDDEREALTAIQAGAKTQDDIAQAVGCRKEAVGPILDHLAQVGLIAARKRRGKRGTR